MNSFVAENEPGVSRFTQQSLPELEQLLRETRQAVRDFRDLSRSLKQNPSRLIYEPTYRGIEVPKSTRRASRWIVLTPLLLSACAGSLFKDKAAPPTMYLLSATPRPLADSPGGALLHTDLAVLKPRVRTGLDTDRIAALYPDRRMDYFADVALDRGCLMRSVAV